MRFRGCAWIVGFGALATAALSPRSAAAYCMLRTCQDPADTGCEQDGNQCAAPGPVLFYDSPCLAYGVQHDSGSVFDLRDEDFDAIVQAGFDRWQNVDCGDGLPPAFAVTSVGSVPVNQSFFCDKSPANNLSVWSFVNTWTQHDPQSVGFTANQFTLETGQVFDADVELNSQRLTGLLGASDWVDVLTAVATHEAGHVLGLGHATEETSIMARSYALGPNLSSRSLTADDVAAICALYPPRSKRLHCPAPSYSTAALSPAACANAARVEHEVDPPARASSDASGCTWKSQDPAHFRLSALSQVALLAFLFNLRRCKVR